MYKDTIPNTKKTKTHCDSSICQNATLPNGTLHEPVGENANTNAIEQRGTLIFLTNLEQEKHGTYALACHILGVWNPNFRTPG